MSTENVKIELIKQLGATNSKQELKRISHVIFPDKETKTKKASTAKKTSTAKKASTTKKASATKKASTTKKASATKKTTVSKEDRAKQLLSML